MSKFSHIVKNTYEVTDDEIITYDTYVNEKILSPFDGIVVIYDPKKCNGFIQIEHYVDHKYYYSNICGVGKSLVKKYSTVAKGEVIGYATNKKVTLEIVNKWNESEDILPFYKDEKINKKSTKIKNDKFSDTKQKKDLDKKHKDEIKQVKKDNKNNSSVSSGGYDDFIIKVGDNPNLPISLVSLPFTLVGSALKNIDNSEKRNKRKTIKKEKEELLKKQKKEKEELLKKQKEKEELLKKQKKQKEELLKKQKKQKEELLKKQKTNNEKDSDKIKISDIIGNDEEKEKKINEEINRIKKLLK